MSRSKKKTPICGIAANNSEKEDKRRVNRKFRHKERIAINKDKDPPEDLDEIETEWEFNKDGRQYFDPDKFPELMRK
jgi:hypothetical protein